MAGMAGGGVNLRNGGRDVIPADVERAAIGGKPHLCASAKKRRSRETPRERKAQSDP
jgi:hypothetical protein